MTLQDALEILVEQEHIADWVYRVRDRVILIDPTFQGNPWEHPRVIAFGEAVQTLQAELKRLRTEGR